MPSIEATFDIVKFLEERKKAKTKFLDLFGGDIEKVPEILKPLIKARPDISQKEIEKAIGTYPTIFKPSQESLIPIMTEQGLQTFGSKTGTVKPTSVTGGVTKLGTPEKGKDDLISPINAQRLGVPYGTTKSEAAKMGLIPIAVTVRERLAGIESSKSILNQIFSDFEKLNPPKDIPELATKGLVQSTQSKFASTQAGQYMASQQQFLTMISRAFGEKGVVTDQDAYRQLFGLPQLGPRGDTLESARNKKNRATGVLNAMADATRQGLTGQAFATFVGLPEKTYTLHAPGQPQGITPLVNPTGISPFLKKQKVKISKDSLGLFK